jgi:hypothetical protein
MNLTSCRFTCVTDVIIKREDNIRGNVKEIALDVFGLPISAQQPLSSGYFMLAQIISNPFSPNCFIYTKKEINRIEVWTMLSM